MNQTNGFDLSFIAEASAVVHTAVETEQYDDLLQLLYWCVEGKYPFGAGNEVMKLFSSAAHHKVSQSVDPLIRERVRLVPLDSNTGNS